MIARTRTAAVLAAAALLVGGGATAAFSATSAPAGATPTGLGIPIAALGLVLGAVAVRRVARA